MDHSLHDLRTRVIQTLRTRIPRLSKSAPKLRVPRWAWILPLTLILSIWAHTGSQAEGKLAWLTAHSPTPESWKEILTRRGFAPLEDPAWREKAYAEMPESSRLKASAFISEDRHTVALRVSGDWLYFELKNAPGKAALGQVVARELWEGLGLGWEAFAAFETIELPIMRTAGAPTLKAKAWRDSRSVEY